MRVQLFTKRPTSQNYLLIYQWEDDLDDQTNLHQVLQQAFTDFPGSILDNIIEIRVQGNIGDWRTVDLPSMRWNKDEHLHLCRGCGQTISHLDVPHCSEVCKIRDAHLS